jgi:sugar O-acyltransferase (sialic acid O-acetyltransferase NeuD family)
MNTKINIVILGAGYGCLEVIPLINSINRFSDTLNIVGLLDDNQTLHGTYVQGFPVLGGLDNWRYFDLGTKFIFAIGSYGNRWLRGGIIAKHNIPLERFHTLIHPSAEIQTDIDNIGNGCIIHSSVIIHPLTIVGNFSLISAGTIIGVKNLIGSFSLLAAGITTATDVSLGYCSFVGSGATIAPNVIVGCNGMIGVGSVVFRDIEAGHKVIGNPAKPFGRDEVSEALFDAHKLDQFNLRNKL